MKSLFDYDVLVFDTFYRGWHVLEYIKEHVDMTQLDKEAICNTIMDALVQENLIDAKKTSLDLNTLTIKEGLDYYKYQDKPNVTAIPLWMKEELRNKSLKVTSGMPVSMFLARPAKIMKYCLYDICTAVSVLFPNFKKLNVLYDSPTRVGVRLTEVRPFLEIELYGEPYLLDVLLKIVYKKSFFEKKYNMEIMYESSIETFDEEKYQYYKEEVAHLNFNGDILFFLKHLIDNIKDEGALAEMYYEIEKSKELYPTVWEEFDLINQDFKMFQKLNYESSNLHNK